MMLLDSQHEAQAISCYERLLCTRKNVINLCMIMTCVQTRYVDAHKTACLIKALCIRTVDEDGKKHLFADVLSSSQKLSHPCTSWQLSCAL